MSLTDGLREEARLIRKAGESAQQRLDEAAVTLKAARDRIRFLETENNRLMEMLRSRGTAA
jgi:predicted nuclease with TOPRIM domain